MNGENATDTGWLSVGRPGYAGLSGKDKAEKRDKLFGPENWRVVHLYKGRALLRPQALQLYEESYYKFFLANPEVLDWLCATASEVYDIEPSNIDAGEDYFKQDSSAVHLQDIAVRRCLRRLGRRFEGGHPVQIRGRDSDGYCLNPGMVPFHDPSEVLEPSLARGKWWKKNSIEDFWQSNKVLQVKDSVTEEALQKQLLKPLPKDSNGQERVALFGGSFNPVHSGHLNMARELVDRYGFARVVFTPNGDHYSKKGLIGENHRLAMLERAIAGEPRFAICRFELGREQVAYTHETLPRLEEELRKEFKNLKLYLLRGSDVINRMLKWQSLPLLLTYSDILVVPRPGTEPWPTFGNEEKFRLHSAQFRVMQRAKEEDSASTSAREKVRTGQPLAGLVPEPVEAYIREHGLYR